MGLPKDFPWWWDWSFRDTGYMTFVKDQEKLNICWSIAAADCTAIGLKIKGIHTELIELSAKDLVDCANPEQLGSCEGYTYSLIKAFKYMAERGVMTETDCPFSAKKEPCKYKTPEQVRALIKIAGYERLNYLNEKELILAVREYPIVGAVDLTTEFGKLKGEIYEGPMQVNKERKQRLHAILIVGYGYDESRDKRFWIIKSSHGTKWGIHGYGRIARHSSLQVGQDPLILRTSRPIFNVNEHDLVGKTRFAWHRVGNSWLWKD